MHITFVMHFFAIKALIKVSRYKAYIVAVFKMP